MSKRSSKTFRLSFLRRKNNNTFKSQALKEALLTEINEGGEDTGLVVQMVERVRPVVNPPIQAVIPVPNPVAPQPGPAPAPGQAPPPVPRQPPPPVADGNTAANALNVLDSEDELVQEMLLTPRMERRMREQLQSWRSSSSD